MKQFSLLLTQLYFSNLSPQIDYFIRFDLITLKKIKKIERIILYNAKLNLTPNSPILLDREYSETIFDDYGFNFYQIDYRKILYNRIDVFVLTKSYRITYF